MSEELVHEIKTLMRDVPDFPIEGIVFKDITPLLQNGPTLVRMIDHFKARYAGRGIKTIVGIESRGFIFGSALAYALGIGFSLVRKPGKLPFTTKSVDYDLEYGTDTVQMHIDAVGPGDKVVIMDDLLATGGTMAAAVQLVEELGADIVELGCVVELGCLDGRAKLNRPIHSLVTY